MLLAAFVLFCFVFFVFLHLVADFNDQHIFLPNEQAKCLTFDHVDQVGEAE